MQIQVVYYTDPLCCWSWAFEPVVQAFRDQYAGEIDFRFCMAGMIAGWDSYHDDLLAIRRPLQMGPSWMQVKYQAQINIDEKIWHDDPPGSSYPSCVAVKCAGRQSPQAENIMLHELRKAVMTQRRNIAKREVLLEVAATVSANYSGLLDLPQFEAQLTEPATVEAFRKDLQERQVNNIKRLPSLMISNPAANKRVLLTGMRPLDDLRNVMAQVNSGEDRVYSQV